MSTRPTSLLRLRLQTISCTSRIRHQNKLTYIDLHNLNIHSLHVRTAEVVGPSSYRFPVIPVSSAACCGVARPNWAGSLHPHPHPSHPQLRLQPMLSRPAAAAAAAAAVAAVGRWLCDKVQRPQVRVFVCVRCKID